MEFIKKIIGFFKKTKEVAEITQEKIKTFITKHKAQIKIFMGILEVIYPAKTGIRKMANVVATVCNAMGLDEYSEDVRQYVEAECQKVYDELKK